MRIFLLTSTSLWPVTWFSLRGSIQLWLMQKMGGA
jgi:hypothetical protein